jgi:polyisoprenyl-phosphate glycosyltransferase
VRVRVGNFSVIPRPMLSRLVAVSDLWNHYAAAVFKSRLPYTTVPTARGRRYAGASRMNIVALVTHGLSAMAAFGDRIGVRLLAATMSLALVLVAATVAALFLNAIGSVSIPPWAPVGLAFVVVVLFQAFAIALAFVFIILAGRSGSTFLPLRDYDFYVLDVQHVFRRVDESVPLRG